MRTGRSKWSCTPRLGLSSGERRQGSLRRLPRRLRENCEQEGRRPRRRSRALGAADECGRRGSIGEATADRGHPRAGPRQVRVRQCPHVRVCPGSVRQGLGAERNQEHSIILSAHSGGGETKLAPMVGAGEAQPADAATLKKDPARAASKGAADLAVLFDAGGGSKTRWT